MPLTGEVKGKVLERTSRFVRVAADGHKPLDEAMAAFFHNRLVDGFRSTSKAMRALLNMFAWQLSF